MKLSKIRTIAKNEKIDESSYVNYILCKRRDHPRGVDVLIPLSIARKVEAFLDKKRIPCHIVAEGNDCATISTAWTYSDLEVYESSR